MQCFANANTLLDKTLRPGLAEIFAVGCSQVRFFISLLRSKLIRAIQLFSNMARRLLEMSTFTMVMCQGPEARGESGLPSHQDLAVVYWP